MNSQKGSKDALDRLLRETLRDDLPVEVKRRLKARFDRFQKQIGDKQPEREPAGTPRHKPIRIPALRWLPQSGLAAAGIFMIVWGGLLQEGGSSHILAKNISLLRTSVLVKDQVSFCESMICRIELIREGEKNAELIIKWLPPDQTRIDLLNAQGRMIRTAWMIQGDCTVIDYATGEVGSDVDLERVADAYISALAGFIHPARLAERLYDEWLEMRREVRGGCEHRTYRLIPPGKAEEEMDMTVELTVDLCEWLPAAIFASIPPDPPEEDRAATMNLRFEWNTPLSPEEMRPVVRKQNEKA